MYQTVLNSQGMFNLSPHLIVSALFVIAVLMLFIAVRFVRKVWVAATVPIALVLVATMFFTIHNIMGQPTERDPRDQFQFIAHKIGPEREWIYIWLIEKEVDYPLTIKTPYTEELHEKVEEARGLKEIGVDVAGSLPGDAEGEFVFHPFESHGNNPNKPE